MFYNRRLDSIFRNTETVGTAVENIVGGITKTTGDSGVGAIPTTTYGNLNPQDKWMRSAMVDIAGDSYGNYYVARSIASPFYQDDDITNSGIGKARMLVGHQYLVGSGFIQRENATSGVNEPQTTMISGIPTCFNGTQYIGCSVRDPKVLVSDNGKGLVLFYQPQPDSYSSSAPSGADISTDAYNPTRLWYGTYSTATGFSKAGILDEDTFCSDSSIDNDKPVCETGSYTSVCENLGEPRDSLTNALITHDVPPIAAAMNADGDAVIAYHKSFENDDGDCTGIGTFVITYDPTNGMDDVTQIDDEEGDTMHVQVAINSSGNIAVVWESVKSDGNYLYLMTRIDDVWSSEYQLNDGMTDAADSMMPNVSINDSNEVMVSFTYGNGTSTPHRRQYAVKYSTTTE